MDDVDHKTETDEVKLVSVESLQKDKVFKAKRAYVFSKVDDGKDIF